ncbi:MAG: DnaA N-terminal domain-containing protein, partial [Myxococcota bacterium]|nr:DnaA N-terminal domain-containing protein [Myxococcota bacterium]
MDPLWHRVLAELKTLLRPEEFDIWMAPAELGRADSNQVEVVWPNRYYRDWVNGNHRAAVEQAVRAAVGCDVEVLLGVAGAATPASSSSVPVPPAAPPAPAPAPALPPGGREPAPQPPSSIPDDKLF